MNDFLDVRAAGLNQTELKKHLATIERLTEQIGMPKMQIGKLYEVELERVASVRIREFLPILIARKLRQELLNSH